MLDSFSSFVQIFLQMQGHSPHGLHLLAQILRCLNGCLPASGLSLDLGQSKQRKQIMAISKPTEDTFRPSPIALHDTVSTYKSYKQKALILIYNRGIASSLSVVSAQ